MTRRLALLPSLMLGLAPISDTASALGPSPATVVVEALVSWPVGTFDLQGFGFDAPDLIATGYGLHAAIFFPLAGPVSIGAGAGAYRTTGGTLFDQLDLDAVAWVFPLHGLLQLQVVRSRAGAFLEAGAGLTVGTLDASGIIPLVGIDLDDVDGTGVNGSFLAGGGVSYRMGTAWGVRAGVRYHHTFTQSLDENAIRSVLFSAGLSFGQR